jgi:hypothetical protein
VLDGGKTHDVLYTDGELDLSLELDVLDLGGGMKTILD